MGALADYLKLGGKTNQSRQLMVGSENLIGSLPGLATWYVLRWEIAELTNHDNAYTSRTIIALDLFGLLPGVTGLYELEQAGQLAHQARHAVLKS